MARRGSGFTTASSRSTSAWRAVRRDRAHEGHRDPGVRPIAPWRRSVVSANCERRVPESIPSAHSSKEHPGGHQPVGPSAVNFVQDINLVERFSGVDGHIDIGSVRPVTVQRATTDEEPTMTNPAADRSHVVVHQPCGDPTKRIGEKPKTHRSLCHRMRRGSVDGHRSTVRHRRSAAGMPIPYLCTTTRSQRPATAVPPRRGDACRWVSGMRC